MIKSKTGTGLLIVIVSAVFVLSPIYFHYNSLIEADFFCRGLKFEAGDLEDLSFDKQSLWLFKPGITPSSYFPDREFFPQANSLLDLLPALETLSALRC
ncbi:MAG TPA: hypothetical protein VLS90_09540 [Thermodesulfobacteriota bacterium]|nr:hypothetical protein [Thermodesulfobacteriota bacterium]